VGHFTQLDQQTIASLSAEFSLGNLRSWKNIAAGTINSNYQVDTSEGRFFLRVNEGKSEAQVRIEVAVLTHLVAQGVPSPLPKRTSQGEGFARWRDKFISVFDWLPGSHVDGSTTTEAHCRAAGSALARLHLAGKSMDTSGVGEGRYSHAEIEKLFASFESNPEPSLQEVVPLLRAEFAWLAQRADLRSHAERSLIHADLFPDNVLMEGTRVVALLDFEQACVRSLVYDLAVAITAWCFSKALHPERAIALLSGYQEVLPLGDAALAALPVELRAAALRFTVTRITDVHLPSLNTGEATALGKDFRRFQMRLETWQNLPSKELQRIADLAQGPE
jgi:homoserine kinase type II